MSNDVTSSLGLLLELQEQASYLSDRARAYHEIVKVWSAHSYCRNAQKPAYELEHFWTREHDDLMYAICGNAHAGREQVIHAYATACETAQKRKLELLHSRDPDEIANSDENLGMGDCEVRLQTTPYIEIAKDNKTAKGVFVVLSGSAELDANGVPMGDWALGHESVDFTKDADGWKIWHIQELEKIHGPLPPNFLEPAPLAYDQRTIPNVIPVPNAKADDTAEIYSAKRIADFRPKLPEIPNADGCELRLPFAIEGWETKSEQEQMDSLIRGFQNVIHLANRAIAYYEIQKIWSTHVYCYYAQAQRMEIEKFWAIRDEDVMYAHGEMAFSGPEMLVRYYAEGNEKMDCGKLKLMHQLYPDTVAEIPENIGIGDFSPAFQTTPYIEIAEDNQTAQVMFYTVSGASENHADGHPEGHYMLGKELIDFKYYPDEGWKIWHFQQSGEINQSLTPEFYAYVDHYVPRASVVPDAAPDYNLQICPRKARRLGDSVTMRIAGFYPEFPKPYDTWTEDLSLLKAAELEGRG